MVIARPYCGDRCLHPVIPAEVGHHREDLMTYSSRKVSSWIGILLAFGIALGASPLYADVTLKAYLDLRQTPEIREKLRTYFTGVGRGIFYSNAALYIRGAQRLFCMPDDLALDEGIIQALLDQEIRGPGEGRSYEGDTSVELILLNAFIYRFPCDR